jgi:hypothetical protein
MVSNGGWPSSNPTYIMSAMIVTVVASPPPPNSYRPPYFRGHPTIASTHWTTDQLQWDKYVTPPPFVNSDRLCSTVFSLVTLCFTLLSSCVRTPATIFTQRRGCKHCPLLRPLAVMYNMNVTLSAKKMHPSGSARAVRSFCFNGTHMLTRNVHT